MHSTPHRTACTRPRRTPAPPAVVLAALLLTAAASSAQAIVAVDDAYPAMRSGILEQVEAPGVLENDHDGSGTTALYVGTQGRGIWRVNLPLVFSDGFESGAATRWSSVVP